MRRRHVCCGERCEAGRDAVRQLELRVAGGIVGRFFSRPIETYELGKRTVRGLSKCGGGEREMMTDDDDDNQLMQHSHILTIRP